ncbi:hypothetical protein [Flavobacterium rhizosphaerae]|uniref:Outer membrane protein beta-barrel domain-containing protein n=1 Tax=Flavobacterium rhizosphaerae TaxID=3163298 RepID=A0ABW8YXE5_9FLAO
MENKKDIGAAFKQKLDGLKKSPPDAVWNAINAELKEKRNKNFVLWRKISLVALAIILLIIIGVPYVSEENNPIAKPNQNNTINNTNYPSVNIKENTDKKPENKPAITNDNTSPNKKGDAANSNAETINNTAGNKAIDNKNKAGAVTYTQTEKDNAANRKGNGKIKNSNRAETTSLQYNTPQATGRASTTRANRTESNNSAAGSAGSGANKPINSPTGNSNAKQEVVVIRDAQIQNKSATAYNFPTPQQYAGQNKTSANDNTSVTGYSDTITPANIILPYNNTVQDLIYIIKQDSIATEAKLIAEALLLQEDANEKKSDKEISGYKKFYVFANISPTKYYIPKNNSLIDASLDTNSTAIKTNYAYGVTLGYNFNNTWGIRTGISIINIDQTTHDVQLQNTYIIHEPTDDYPDGQIEIIPPAEYTGINYASGQSNASLAEMTQNALVFNLIQNTGFIAIPLEVTYNLHNKRFGINAFMGINTLLLTENSVIVKSNALSGNVTLGSLKDVNKISFSSSGGISVYYKVTPALQLNVEPVAKYYFNTFAGVKPYSFGIQCGLQYNFDFK